MVVYIIKNSKTNELLNVAKTKEAAKNYIKEELWYLLSASDAPDVDKQMEDMIQAAELVDK